MSKFYLLKKYSLYTLLLICGLILYPKGRLIYPNEILNNDLETPTEHALEPKERKSSYKFVGIRAEKPAQPIRITTQLLIPIFIGCFILWFGSFLLWDDRYEILARSTKFLREIDPLVKLFIFIAIIMSYSLIYLSNVPEPIALFSLCFICIPTAWFCVKKVAYSLIYLTMKAIEDAKKDTK